MTRHTRHVRPDRDPADVLRRSARCQQVIHYLADHPGATHGAIRHATTIPASTLAAALTRLEHAGIITTDNPHGPWGRRGYPQHYRLNTLSESAPSAPDGSTQ